MKIKLFNIRTIKQIVSAKLVLVSIITINLLLSNVINLTYADSKKEHNSITQTKLPIVKPTVNDWEKNGGIRVLSIRQSAAGYMLDFRYKVLNPEKAALFLDRSSRPRLHVLKNGSILQVPVSAKIGPLRQSAQLAKAGKNYFMFFVNPGQMVKSGDKVKVNIGDFESKILIVE